MVEVFDYYAQGLDKRKDVVALHKLATKEYNAWLSKEKGAKPGTPGAAKAAAKKDQWSKALVLFSSEAGRKKYDAELTAWQSSVDAQRAKGQTDQLAKDFASATETVLELVARAWEELDKGNLQAASQVASKAMRVDASHWESYLIAGIASFRQNDFEESMSCMRQAARLNPENAQVFSGLGELYERQDNWQEAFKHYSKAIALAPDDIDYKIRAGFVCVKAEAPDQGIELLRKALEIDPEHQGAKWALGVALADSAQLGWTEVPDGHPRVPPGWYAMSREQALQAIRKLHEANTLGVEDEELSTHLAKVKQDVDRNIKRHFDGSWVLFGVILLVAFFLKDNIGAALLVAVIAAAYYGAHLPPQYSTNARILAGDSKLKTGFFDWLDNIQNQWIKLTINLILIALLPVFTLYFAIKNWTGENAPLGDALKAIQGPPLATPPPPPPPPPVSVPVQGPLPAPIKALAPLQAPTPAPVSTSVEQPTLPDKTEWRQQAASAEVASLKVSSPNSVSSNKPKFAGAFEQLLNLFKSIPGRLQRKTVLILSGVFFLVTSLVAGSYYFYSRNSQQLSNESVQNVPVAPTISQNSVNSSLRKTETIVIQDSECGDRCALIVQRGKRSDEYYLCKSKDLPVGSAMAVPICQEIFGTGSEYPKLRDRTVTLELRPGNDEREFWIVSGRLHPVEVSPSAVRLTNTDSVPQTNNSVTQEPAKATPALVKPPGVEKNPKPSKGNTQRPKVQPTTAAPIAVDVAPPPKPESVPIASPKAPPSARTLDEAYNQRITADCSQGFFPGMACREKIRWQLCDGKWSPDPAPGQLTCKGTAAQ